MPGLGGNRFDMRGFHCNRFHAVGRPDNLCAGNLFIDTGEDREAVADGGVDLTGPPIRTGFLTSRRLSRADHPLKVLVRHAAGG